VVKEVSRERGKMHGMNLNDVCAGLLEALQKFDEDTLPLGLYASDELVEQSPKRPYFQEWKGAIEPFLSAHKLRPELLRYWSPRKQSKHGYRAAFVLPDAGNVALQVVKFSNIKVRKYGSAYHVDKHENRAARWSDIDLSGHISSLWKQPDWFSYRAHAQMLLFIGFDKAQRPLEAELSALHRDLNWEKRV
jgi:hypothetical protein